MDSSPTRSIVFRAVRARRRWLQPKEHAALGLAGATSVVAPAFRSEWECPRSASSTSLPDPGAALPAVAAVGAKFRPLRSEEHTSELQSLMRISYAVFCLKKKKNTYNN